MQLVKPKTNDLQSYQFRTQTDEIKDLENELLKVTSAPLKKANLNVVPGNI